MCIMWQSILVLNFQNAERFIMYQRYSKLSISEIKIKPKYLASYLCCECSKLILNETNLNNLQVYFGRKNQSQLDKK